MFFTADQLVAHAIGDYIIQSDWMASNKTKASIAAAVHAITYLIPFLFLTQSLTALAFIGGTHFVIDRWRLARYLCWAKNWVGIPDTINEYGGPTADWSTINKPWRECKATGYSPDKPAWMATWLLIIADNICHVALNALALKYMS